ncbi:hypothetical protein KBY30_17390 [Ruegeria pomeroyi]|nr:hypothetical protein [Ruegeria pomeroyi]
MEPTTGLILRRITQTNLSVAAHKLATLILDAIAWKDAPRVSQPGAKARHIALTDPPDAQAPA